MSLKDFLLESTQLNETIENNSGVSYAILLLSGEMNPSIFIGKRCSTPTFSSEKLARDSFVPLQSFINKHATFYGFKMYIAKVREGKFIKA